MLEPTRNPEDRAERASEGDTPIERHSLPEDVRDAARDERNLVGDYVLVQPVGIGGAGVVYRSWQRSLRRYVALKLLHARDGEEAERAAREAQIAARLNHPHIVPIHEIGSHDGQQYLTMKLVAGVAMSKVKLAPEIAVAVMRDVADAVDHAHRAGIVHRDLKPQNLLLEESTNHVWVTDFGLAKQLDRGSTLTAPGAVLGTPAYMSPEQARGLRCDQRSDVYSLGATFYHLLAGRPPYEGETAIAIMMQQLHGEPMPVRRSNPRVHAEVETIVHKAMAKDPAQRYASARELAEDLRRHVEGEPIAAKPPTLAVRAFKWAKRHPGVTTAFVALTAVAAIIALYAIDVARARHRAELHVVETMVAEGNALGAAGSWEQARARYVEASQAFRRLGVRSPGPDLGLLDAHHHAPTPLLVLRGHSATVRAVAFLPDGKQALSGADDGTLRLWDLQLGRETLVLRGHALAVTSVALSADGRLALSGSDDGTVRLWDLQRGQALQSLAPRGGRVRKVALSPDGRFSLSRTEAGVVQLLELATGREVHAFNVNVNRVGAVAFSRDGRRALTGLDIQTGGQAGETLRYAAMAAVWEVPSGRLVQTLGPFRAEVESVVLSPDGRRALAAGFDQLVSVWDVESGRQMLSLKGHRHGVNGAAFSERDRVIVSAGQDRTVRLWDATSGQPIRTLETGHGVEALALSPDGRFILSGGDDNALKLWDLSVGQELRLFSGHERAVQGLAFTADGRYALSAGRDQRLRLWDVATGLEIRAIDTENSWHGVAITPDSRVAVSASTSRIIAVWDLRTGRRLKTLVGHSGPVRCVALSPDGRLVVSGSEGGEVKLWDLATARELLAWKHGSDVRNVAFSPDGAAVMAGGTDGTIKLWDVRSGHVLRSLSTSPPERISAVAISPDGRLVAAGSLERTVRLWDLADGRQLRSFHGHEGDIRGLRFSPDGRRLFSASRDRTVRVWDRDTGHELHAFAWASDGTWSFALSHDGRLALAGNEDGSMNFLDFSYTERHRDLETRLSAALTGLRATPGDGQALVVVGEWYAFRGLSTWALELFRRAERAGAKVSSLVLARCHWREGDLSAARREFQRAKARGEAPADYLDFLVAQLGSSDQAERLSQLSLTDGRMRYPFIGIRSVTSAGGAKVTRVFPDSPAAAAGLVIDDVIVRADDVDVDNDRELGNFLASRSTGSVIALRYQRAGQTHSTQVKLAERPVRAPGDLRDLVRDPKTGWLLQTLTPELAASLGLPLDMRGAVMVEPPPNAMVLAIRIQRDEVLVRVQGEAVLTAEDAVAKLARVNLADWEHLKTVRPGTVR